MSIQPHEPMAAQPVRRRRRNFAAELAAARSAWRTQTLAAGLRCDRCSDATTVVVDDHNFCSECFLVFSIHKAEADPRPRTLAPVIRPSVWHSPEATMQSAENEGADVC